MTVTGSAQLGENGRIRIPADVRYAAGFQQGAEMVFVVEGYGQVHVATREALRDEVWAAAAGCAPGGDAVREIRADRERDRRLSDERLDRLAGRSAGDPNEIDEVGEALLRSVGRFEESHD